METATALLLLAIIIALYFLPFILSLVRHKRNWLAIGALNLLLGWTAIGWIIALVWGLTADAPVVATQVVVHNAPSSPDPA